MDSVQIYSGYMERAFVPVEKRGKGLADDASKSPSSDKPNHGYSDGKSANGEHSM